MKPKISTNENAAIAALVDQPAVASNRFSIHLFIVVFFFTGAVLGWLTWSTYNLYTRDTNIREQTWHSAELRKQIIHLDEVLTMSARMAVTTEDPQWEQRYRILEPQLDQTIKEVLKLTSSQMVAETDAANQKLVAMENQAFTLVRDGNAQRAREILTSEKYETQKKIYASEMSKFLLQLDSVLHTTHLSQRRGAVFSVGVGIAVLTILLFSGLGIMRSLYKAHAILIRSITQRKQAEGVLLNAHRELELRVKERTAELGQANEALQSDIAQRRRVEEAFLKSETRFQSAFDNAPTGITLVNLAGGFIQVNKSFCEILGYTKEELLATNFHSITHPDDLAASHENMPRLLAGEITNWQLEKRYIHKLGHEVFASTSVSLVRDAQAEPLHFIAQIQNITENRRAEMERQVIAEIVQSVITAANLDELFKLAHRAVNKILPAENCFITLHNPATDVMHYEYWVDKFDTAPLPRPLGKGFSSYMMRTGQPLLLTKEFKDQMRERGEVEQSGTCSRSWLGVPLRTRSRTIGVLVVQHYEQEHAYNQRDLEFLSAVGDQLGLAIQRKQIELELKTNEMQLIAAQQIAHIGNWKWDVVKKNLHWSEELFRIFGLQSRVFGPSVAEFFAQVYPEDVKLVERAIKKALRRGDVPSFNFRIVRADQTVRVLQVNGEMAANEDGRLTSLWGTIQDITERVQVENELRQSEEKYRELIENANDILYTIDLSGQFTSLNRAGQRVTGYTLAEALQINIADVVVQDDVELVGQRIARNLAAMEQGDVELEIIAKDGRRITLDISSRIIRQDNMAVGVQGIARDITERRRAEKERQAVSEVIQSVSQTSNLNSLFENVHQSLSRVIDARNCFVALHDDKTEFFKMQFFIDQFDELPPPQKLTRSRTAYVFRTGRAMLMTENLFQQLVEKGEVEKVGTPPASWLGVPLTTPSGVIGVLVVQHYADPGAYSEGDLKFLTDVAGQIGLAIERKQAEEALRESEERYRDLFENANDIIYTHDLMGNYTSVNKACEVITGYTVAESIGQNLVQLVAPEDVETVKSRLAQRVDQQGPVAYEVDVVAKDHHRVTLEINSRLTYQDGKPSGVQGIARDITERKRAEAERQVISEIVTGIITTSNMGELLNLIHHSIGKVLYAENCYVALYENKTGLLHLPLSVDQYDPVAPSMKIGNGLTAYIFRSGRSRLLTKQAIQELIAQGEVELIGTLPAVWLGVPLRTPAEIIGVLVVQHYENEHAYSKRDLEFLSSVGDQIALTIESKRMEERLRESEEKYRTILESIEDGYFEVELDGTYAFLNDAFLRMTERSEEEMVGHSYKEFFAPDLIKTLYDAYSGVYKTGKPLRAFEYEIINKEGAKKFVEESVTLKRDGKGQPTGFIGIRRDCSERKKMGAELEKARDAALESTRLKSEFLANMSHEIRTPMNGVIGMTGLLLDTGLNAEQRDFAETIQSSGDALLTIINDILDFSKIEAGKLQFETLAFDLDNAVEGAVELLAEQARDKKIELASLIYRDVATKLQGDPGRLRQVLTNLLGNAVKFTEEGEVIVRAEKETESDGDIVIRFTVSDTGIGIDETTQQRLFQSFTQADGSTTRKYGGTGLGLAISKQLVDLMGGQIGVDSVPGKGSSFWFTARFTKQSSQVEEPRVDKASLNELRVLIVDDNATNRKILSHQVTSWGMPHEESDSGAGALELMCSAVAEGHPFDLVILDLMMPGMDGFELARRINADPLLVATRLVMLTSYGQRGDGATAREAGVVAYLTKPVRQSQLFDCLTNIVSHPSLEPAKDLWSPSAPARLGTRHLLRETRTTSNKLILLAEDNIVNQKVAVRQLQKLGYRADAVANGREAVEALMRISYDAVLMDCQMPEMDGYEATTEIRRLEGMRKHTMIVAMTAHALQGDRENCLAAGMDDYISKPVKSEDLERVLQRVFSVSANDQIAKNCGANELSTVVV